MLRYFVIVMVCALAHPARAQSPGDSQDPKDSKAARESESPEDSEAGDLEQAVAGDASDQAERLANYLTDVKFVGKFTIDGQPEASPKAEEYTIERCEKLPADDLYRLTVRIQYGEVDSELPLDLKILWAGNTPVITLDAVWIPGMGTFSARVLMHRDRYSGTWQHGDNGGHLFGRIVKNASSP